MVRLVIVDGHALTRDWLRASLAAAPSVQVVGEHLVAASALAAVTHERPDVAVAYLERLDDGGFRALRALSGGIRGGVIALVTSPSDQIVAGTFATGARGLVTTDSRQAGLITAVRHVATGRVYIDPMATAGLVSFLLAGRRALGPFGLSVAERRVLRLSQSGGSVGQIAVQLRVSPSTVKTQLTSARSKLGVAGNGQRRPLALPHRGALNVFVVVAREIERDVVAERLSAAPDVRVVGVAGTTAEAQAQVSVTGNGDTPAPDVIVTEYQLPGNSGKSSIAELAEAIGGSGVVSLHEEAAAPLLYGAFGAGADAYVLKDSDAEVWIDAVRGVAAGGMFVDPRAGAIFVDLAIKGTRAKGPHDLTRQQMRIYDLLVKGLTNKEIARELGLGFETVKTHVKHVMDKIGIRNRAELARHALEDGFG